MWPCEGGELATVFTPCTRVEGRLSAFLISFIGIAADYASTRVGLSRGFYETHVQYHPLLALAIFWTAVAVLVTSLPRGRWWERGIRFIAAWSFLGAVNNTLVILGVFGGLII